VSNISPALAGQQNQRAPSWRDVIKIHPAALLIPPMSAEEVAALADDIAKNGLQQPVVFYLQRSDDRQVVNTAPQLLEGRHRLDALERLGRQFEYDDRGWLKNVPSTVLGDIDPYAYVISANLKRRHLTNEGKRQLIANVLRHMADRSNHYIAKLLGVDDKTVASVRIDLSRSEIPNSATPSGSEIPNTTTRTGADGRQQPARKSRKPKPKPEPDDVEASARRRSRKRNSTTW
jgi:hypothetical protein